MSSSFPRNPFVCLRQRCHVKCPQLGWSIPENCPFKILHPLETKVCGKQNRPRQSGKTRELVAIAKELVEEGYPVYYVSETEQMCDCTIRNHQVPSTINVMSWRQAIRRLPQEKPGIILADEITEVELERVKEAAPPQSGYLILAHYWTERA